MSTANERERVSITYYKEREKWEGPAVHRMCQSYQWSPLKGVVFEFYYFMQFGVFFIFPDVPPLLFAAGVFFIFPDVSPLPFAAGVLFKFPDVVAYCENKITHHF